MAKIRTISKRSIFTKVYAGRKCVTPSVVVFAAMVDNPSAFAFVASKKVGGAVQRNYAKRLMRAALVSLPYWRNSRDKIILLARHSICQRPFEAIRDDIAHGLRKVTDLSSEPPRGI